MPNATPFNTCFCGPDGLDIGSKLLEKDQLLETYPGLIPSVQGKNIYANGCGLNFVLGTGSTVTASPGTLACTIDVPNWTQITSSWKFPGWDDTEELMASAAGIKSDGTLWTWGTNCCGRLGDGTTIIKCSPVQTIAGGNNWCSVSISKFRLNDNKRTHTAALKTDGSLWLWGYNGEAGQLGIGTAGFNASVSSPVQTISAGNTWSKVTTGTRFSVAQKTDGTLWSWGYNGDGQLGDGTTLNRSSPVQVLGGITDWTSISAGYHHVIGLRKGNTLWVWGDNCYGQHGRNASYYNSTSQPAQVGTASTWCSIAAAGFSNIAVKTDSSLWIWGYNRCGELPGGASSYGTYPGPLIDPPCRYSSVVQVVGASLGWKRVFPNLMAQKFDGSLWCWSAFTQASPVQFVDGVKNWVNVSGKFQIRDNEVLCSDLSGFKFTHSSLGSVDFDDVYVRKVCFSDGELWMSGCNQNGGFGDGTTINKCSPVQIWGSNWKVLAYGGQAFSAGIKQDGTLWTWGCNQRGQIGDGTTINKCSPVQTISGGTNWKSVAAGRQAVAAIKSDGTLWTWGDNGSGRLGQGDGSNKCSPVQILGGGTNWKQVVVGDGFMGALKTDGTLWTWGYNSCGALGDNTLISRSSPGQTISGGTNWKKISSTVSVNLGAIKTDGTLWMWGDNSFGSVGANDIGLSRYSSPVQTIAGGNNWADISIASARSFGIKTDGTLWGWGDAASSGALGDGTNRNKSSPVQILGYWKCVFAGANSTAAIKNDGQLWVWGSNSAGILGDGTTTNDRSSPVQFAKQGNWKQVSIFQNHLGAIRQVDDSVSSGGGGGGGGTGL